MRSRLFSLRLAWRASLLRTMAREIRSWPRRIAAIRSTPFLWVGPEIPRGIGFGDENLHQENKFQVACNENMRLLRNELRWPECLDLQIAAISFQHGAQWAYRNYSGTQSVESFKFSEGGNFMPPLEVQQDSKCDL
jgi:hypothetical protein